MTQDLSVPTWALLVAAGLVLLLGLVLALIVRSSRRRVEAQMLLSQQAAQALAEQVAGLEARLNGAAGSAYSSSADHDGEQGRADFVITRFGDLSDDEESDLSRREAEIQTLPRAVFADLLLRETAVRAAGMAAGLRRALAPETRNRIRFEMKQEVKRSRKQRKTDLRVARREWEARQRVEQLHADTA